MTEEETTETQEEIPVLASGLSIAFGYSDAPEPESGGRRRGGPDRFADLRQWEPKTRLGRMVMNGEILTYTQALTTGLPIREVEIIDALIPNLEEDVLAVNMIQRMTDSGRRVRFNVLCVVGNEDGYVGLAICKGKEVASTIQKAITKAKMSLIPVMRGNGSWESGIGPGKSVPIKVTGRSGSTRVTLMPAPAGKGLVIGDTGRRVLNKAGITDVWSSTSGQTRTTINFAQATFNALKQLNMTRIGSQDKQRLHITHGGGLIVTFLVIRVRSDRGVERSIRETMSMLNLTKVNHATIIPDRPTYAGMLQKAKDFVTWGEVDAATIANLLRERGRMTGDKPVDDSSISSGSEYSSLDDFAAALASGDATLKSVEGLKPVLRLHPPRGAKGWGGIKRSYKTGGALGFRGTDIGDLVSRMV